MLTKEEIDEFYKVARPYHQDFAETLALALDVAEHESQISESRAREMIDRATFLFRQDKKAKQMTREKLEKEKTSEDSTGSDH